MRQRNLPQPHLATEVDSAPTVQHYGLAGTQALPVDTNSEPLTLPVGEKQPRTSQPQGTRNEGMPTKFDKKAWMRENMPSYMRQYRAEVKAGTRIPKTRASTPDV